MYLGSPLAPSEQFLRVIANTVSWAAVLILPQIQLNSQVSRCAFFKVITRNHGTFYDEKRERTVTPERLISTSFN